MTEMVEVPREDLEVIMAEIEALKGGFQSKSGDWIEPAYNIDGPFERITEILVEKEE